MSDPASQVALRKTIAGFRAWVEEMAASGIDGFPRAVTEASPETSARSPARSAFDTAPQDARSIDAGSTEVGAKAATLERVRAELGDCRRCKLCGGRTNLVFGVGSPGARVMFVGEGPGEEEDRKGEPFVGRAGQLLTDIIRKGMGLERSQVYIANVVKCRPPGNRNPQPDEIAACQPFLVKQIEAIAPEVIVALGKFAAQTLLETTTPISRLRGRWHDYRGRRLMPTFHPSYLLRNPADKRLVWQDIQLVLQELGLPVPAPGRRS